MPTPEGFSRNPDPMTQSEVIKQWEQVSSEWQKRELECQKIDTIISLAIPRIKELEVNEKDLKEKLKEFEKASRQISSARKLINFLDYKNAPRKLLEGVVTSLFDLTNRLGESLDVGIKLKLGKNLEFLTQQSRAGKWIEQKTERLGHGKGAILGICFRLACQKLLLPETGFLILDEPTANVDI
jgi:DNA repair exonuclease SbcCD ATPase subunit